MIALLQVCLALLYLDCVLSVPKPEISKIRKSKVKVWILFEIFLPIIAKYFQVSKRQLSEYGAPAAPVSSIDSYGSPANDPCSLEVSTGVWCLVWPELKHSKHKIWLNYPRTKTDM